jgi:hypothetical protein
MTGSVIASTTTLGWDTRTVSLATAGSNGKVTLLLDLRAGAGMAGYAFFDNLVIASSDTPGDTGNGNPPPIPEPSTWALMAAGVFGLLGATRRMRARRKAA